MNKIVVILILLIAQTTHITAQITVDQTDMPSPGDTIRMSTGLNLDFIDYTETGPDFFWDFTEVIMVTQRVDTFVTVLQTPIFYWPFFLTSANLASPIIEDSLLPGLPITNVYQFYNNSSSNYKDVGFAATISGIPLPIKYDEPDVLYKFPLAYGNVDSSSSGFEMGLPDIAYILIEKQRINTVDGWGTLATPYGTFDVLRVKSEVTEYDSIYIDSLQIGIPLNREYTEYKWLGKDYGLPLLTVTDDLFGLVVEYIDSARNVVVDIPDKPIITGEVNLYPNPATHAITVEMNIVNPHQVSLILTNMVGKIISKEDFPGKKGMNKFHVDLSGKNLSPGQYFVTITSNGKSVTRTIIYSP